jgi:ribosome-associated protein
MVDIIAAKMGADILLLDLTGITIIADYFVIATADSDRQLQAIADDLQAQLKADESVRPLAVEGTAGAGWVLLDYGSVVVHLFSPHQREYYALEEFWEKGRTVVRVA